MKLRKKVKVALVFLLICLILMLSASYAWLTLSLRPEITSIDTNVGANGSLEIALLTEKTYVDPLLIRTTIGDSAVEQDAVESNQHWGNVIELADERYGLGKISLLPARLNVVSGENGAHVVSKNMLNVAEFGIDGRITILSEGTVSTVMEENAFTYYVDSQRYGVRAIGTISNLMAQQIALANARTSVQAHTAAASRTVKHTWRDHGPGIVDILYRRYSLENDTFTAEDVAAVRDMANGMADALNYVDGALRQGIIGIAASQIADEPEFESLCAVVSDTTVPLSVLMDSLGGQIPDNFRDWIVQTDQMKMDVQTAVAGSYALLNGGTWAEIEPLLDVILDGEKAYLGEKLLSSKEAYTDMTEDNLLTLPAASGVMAQIAAYAGNYSTFCVWVDNISVEARSADPNETPYLIQIEKILENCKAAVGGWTRTNLDDTYGFAVDMAFRCNAESELLLQTVPALRVGEGYDTPATQGSGSYMRFTSEDMETEQLLTLMDTIRIGFLDDQNTLVGLAKLNVSNYEEQEEGVFAPLYLYEYILEEDGSISVGERRNENVSIAALKQNSPVVLTVVVWLDGDHVDNSQVNYMSEQSMSGVLNLQFASSADLLPSNQTTKD